MISFYSQSKYSASSTISGWVWYGSRALTVLILAFGLNLTSFAFMAEETVAYYSDQERSVGNTMTAAQLDFQLTSTSTSGYIGLEAGGSIDDYESTVQLNTDSLPVQYDVTAEFVGGSKNFCDTLDVWVDHKGANFQYLTVGNADTLPGLTRGTTTQMGTYEFKELGVSPESAEFAHGTACNVDLVFSGWRDDASSPAESGYTDTERISLQLKNRMVVMNEFLPNPDDSAHGLDYGSDHDSQPNGEWIELYNNSEKPADLSGWYFKDKADNVVSISAGNTEPATTTVPAKEWLVVYMNEALLNNTGDTIMLKDASGTVVDEYTYDGGQYCEKEPTPNATNTDTAAGDCSSVPPNKSYARVPDGTGGWVDPIPTPGSENTKEQPDKAASSPDVAGTSTVATSTNSGEEAIESKKTDSSTVESSTSTSTEETSSSKEASSSTKALPSTSASSTTTSSAGSSGDATQAASSSENQAVASSSTASTTNDSVASSTNASSTNYTTSARGSTTTLSSASSASTSTDRMSTTNDSVASSTNASSSNYTTSARGSTTTLSAASSTSTSTDRMSTTTATGTSTTGSVTTSSASSSNESGVAGSSTKTDISATNTSTPKEQESKESEETGSSSKTTIDTESANDKAKQKTIESKAKKTEKQVADDDSKKDDKKEGGKDDNNTEKS